MDTKHTHFFETTSRLEENCEIASSLKKRLETSNNYTWLALAEIQKVSEALCDLNKDYVSDDSRNMLEEAKQSLHEVGTNHLTVFEKTVFDMNTLSKQIAEDLDTVKAMMNDRDFFEMRTELENIGRTVVAEFRKPATMFSEAEELQGLIERYRNELLGLEAA